LVTESKSSPAQRIFFKIHRQLTLSPDAYNTIQTPWLDFWRAVVKEGEREKRKAQKDGGMGPDHVWEIDALDSEYTTLCSK